MKPHHVAALALAGWYLMIPPFVKDPSGVIVGPEQSAPIGQWRVMKSFDSAADCERAKDQEPTEQIRAGQQLKLSSQVQNAWMQAYAMAECIESGDLRLTK